MNGTADWYPVSREASDASQVLPAVKEFSGPPDIGIIWGSDLVGEPPGQKGKVVAAVRQVVMDEQAAQVLHAFAMRFRIT